MANDTLLKNLNQYCYTQCKVGCNKETKHQFVNTQDKTQITLACCECVLKKSINETEFTVGQTVRMNKYNTYGVITQINKSTINIDGDNGKKYEVDVSIVVPEHKTYE